MTNINKQALREAAEKATPGRWEYYPGNTSIEYNVDSMDEDQGSIVYVDSGDFTQKQTDMNGAFIAAANPATVLALLDELEAAEKRIAELESERDKQGRHACELFDEAKAQRQRTAELEVSHSKLRESMAAIHNTIRLDGVRTSLSAIMGAAKRAHDESAAAAGIKGE